MMLKTLVKYFYRIDFYCMFAPTVPVTLPAEQRTRTGLFILYTYGF